MKATRNLPTHLQQGSPQVCHMLLAGWVLLLQSLQRS
jgi:hypothetical protein